MTRYGVVKTDMVKNADGTVRKAFGEFSGGYGNQFVIERPGGSNSIDQERLIGNNKGFVYAAVNAKAREVMAIDWRLFQVKGDDHEEQEDHDLLNLLDAPNDNMSGLELKYLTSALLDVQGNTYAAGITVDDLGGHEIGQGARVLVGLLLASLDKRRGFCIGRPLRPTWRTPREQGNGKHQNASHRQPTSRYKTSRKCDSKCRRQ
jgi:hypothetical protein